MQNLQCISYEDFRALKSCYRSLYDPLSKKLLDLRFRIDLNFDPELLDELVSIAQPNWKSSHFSQIKGKIEAAQTSNLPLYIYGGGKLGRKWMEYLQNCGFSLAAFYDRNYHKIDRVNGIPVLPPPVSNEGGCVLISAADHMDAIEQYLLSVGYHAKQVFKCYPELQNDLEYQYFDFMEYYDPNGAFVDAGCFDCGTSLRFVNWCEGRYSKIYAFEPDASNLLRCQEVAQKHQIKNIEFYQMGLSSHTGEAAFNSEGTSSSQISQSGDTIIQLVTLDEIVGDTLVSFIKMDIEGSELSALQGAARTIQRDRPLCAISAYHRPGDIIVLMQYLKSLVPEYKFAVRHYSNVDAETVLYAFV